MHGKMQREPNMEKHGKIGEIRTQSTHQKEHSTTDHNAGNGGITANVVERTAHSKQIIHQKPRAYKEAKVQEEMTERNQEEDRMKEDKVAPENETDRSRIKVTTKEHQAANGSRTEERQENEDRMYAINGSKQEDAVEVQNADFCMTNKQNEKYPRNRDIQKNHQAKDQEKEKAEVQ